MAVKIRLKRLGKIRSPHYRIVVADSRTKRDGRAIEEIGKYHPKNDPSVIEVNSERAQYWLSVGAQPTEAVVALLKRTGDWQQYSGDASPSGVEPQPEKKNKTDAFNAALAEAGKEPTSAARNAGQEGCAEVRGSCRYDRGGNTSRGSAGSRRRCGRRRAVRGFVERVGTSQLVRLGSEPFVRLRTRLTCWPMRWSIWSGASWRIPMT